MTDDNDRGPEGLARLMGMAIDLHAQGKRGEALSVLGRVCAILAGGKQVRRRDLLAAAVAGGLCSNGYPHDSDAADAVALAAVQLADKLVAELDN
jgi:hypothetical protein